MRPRASSARPPQSSAPPRCTAAPGPLGVRSYFHAHPTSSSSGACSPCRPPRLPARHPTRGAAGGAAVVDHVEDVMAFPQAQAPEPLEDAAASAGASALRFEITATPSPAPDTLPESACRRRLQRCRAPAELASRRVRPRLEQPQRSSACPARHGQQHRGAVQPPPAHLGGAAPKAAPTWPPQVVRHVLLLEAALVLHLLQRHVLEVVDELLQTPRAATCSRRALAARSCILYMCAHRRVASGRLPRVDSTNSRSASRAAPAASSASSAGSGHGSAETVSQSSSEACAVSGSRWCQRHPELLEEVLRGHEQRSAAPAFHAPTRLRRSVPASSPLAPAPPGKSSTADRSRPTRPPRREPRLRAAATATALRSVRVVVIVIVIVVVVAVAADSDVLVATRVMTFPAPLSSFLPAPLPITDGSRRGAAAPPPRAGPAAGAENMSTCSPESVAWTRAAAGC